MRSRRRLVVAAVAATLIAGSSACSAPDEGTSTNGSGAASAEPGAFPVTIDHRYGETTIDRAPQRVATTGPGDADILLALGITPTTMTPFGLPDNRLLAPWNEKYLRGTSVPVTLQNATSDPSADLPAVLATDPQLIVAVNNAVSRSQYDTLAKVAPTIVRPQDAADFQVPWVRATTEIGASVGRPRETATLIAATRKLFDDAKAAHPQFAGTTGAVVIGGTSGQVYVYGPGDGRGQILTDLGIGFPDDLARTVNQGFYGEISTENLGLLNRLDRLVVVDYAGSNDRLRANPAFTNLDVVTRGRAVYVDQTVGSAMSLPTVLTIPHVLGQLVPRLAR